MRERPWALPLVVLIHLALLIVWSLSRHWGHFAWLNDLGLIDQVMWNLVQGHGPVQTVMTPYTEVHWFGWHFTPILYLLLPFYLLHATAVWLIVAQCAALSGTALIIQRIARAAGSTEREAFMWAVAYLCHPSLWSAAAWDFHTDTLSVPVIALALLGLVRGSPILWLVSLFLLWGCKEHFGLAIALHGVVWGWLHRRPRTGAMVFVAGLLGLGLVLGLLVPAFHGGAHPMLRADSGMFSRYGWIHRPPAEAIAALLGLLTSKEALLYYSILFLPLLALPLLAPEILLIAGGDLAANLLSLNGMPRSPFAYHTSPVLPILMTAAILGLRRLRTWKPDAGGERIPNVIVFTVVLNAWILAPFPLPGSADVWKFRTPRFAPDPAVATLAASIQPDGLLSAQNNVGSSFSHRREIVPFPYALERARYVLLHLENPREPHAVPDNAFRNPFGVEPDLFLDGVRQVLDDPAFGVVRWEPPWLLLERGAPDRPALPSVREELQRLEASLRP